MGAATGPLRQLIRAFESQGINNPIQIAEGVAFLLLVRVFVYDEWQELDRVPSHNLRVTFERQEAILNEQFPHFHLPSPPSDRIANSLREVIYLLNEAISQAQRSHIGELFQRDIRTELLRSATSGQYPTPAHIAQFIASLAITKKSESVLDPTAGTGGLLVAAHNLVDKVKCVGIDYDPQWAGMGSANLLFNRANENESPDEFHLDLALNHYQSISDTYDAVVMNPPFGGTLDAYQIAETVGSDYGRDRSAALAGLALTALKNDGIAAFLLPSTVLTGGSGARHLRNTLIDQYQLEAVITLPPDSFQPYSQIVAHLIVARKVDTRNATWFCSLTTDGYPTGAGRDITEDPPNQSELPRTHDLILFNREDRWATRLTLENNVGVQTMQLDPSGLGGIAVRLTNLVDGIEWQVSALEHGVMLRLRKNDVLSCWLYEPFTDNNHIEFLGNQSTQINWLDQLTKEDWAEGVDSEWQGTDEATLEVKDGALTLKKERTSVKFDGVADAGSELSIACLIDGTDSQVTPWISTNRDLSKIDVKTVFGGITVEDAIGTHIGWLINMNPANQEDAPSGKLLVILRPHESASLFEGDGDSYYALLTNGWLKVTSENQVQVMLGEPTNVPSNTTFQGIAIGRVTGASSTEHSVFGVLLHISESIISDIRPSRFLPEPPPLPIGNPAQIVARIRRSQNEFNVRLESLLSMIGDGFTYGENLDETADFPPWIISLLDSRQKQILEIILSEQANSEPTHFSRQMLFKWCKDSYTHDQLSHQLRLLIQLGIIKEIHFQRESEQALNMYRLITNRDVRSATSAASTTQEPTQ